MVLSSAVEEEVEAGSIVALKLSDADIAKELFVVLPDDAPETSAAARFAAALVAA